MFNEKIIRQLAAESGYDIHVTPTTGSTNNDLKRLAVSGQPSDYVLISAEQTAGKGRLGRSFFSPKNGIYLSLLLRPCCEPEKTLYLTTAAAVAVCRAIETTTPHAARIKWVNDVYIADRKVCGILTEGAVAKGVTEWAVVGIGVNLLSPDGGFPKEIRSRAAALYDDRMPDGFEDRFAAELILELSRVYSSPPADTLADYRSRSFIIGRSITAITPTAERPCRAVSITDSCGLEVEFPSGEREVLRSGEVSIKL